MKVDNHHGQTCFLTVVKSQEEIKKDIEQLIKFGWSISMIYDEDGYASHAHNDEFLTIEALSDDFSSFYLVMLDNEYIDGSEVGRTVIKYTTIEGM